MTELSPIAMVMMKALSVAYPDAVTIEPKTDLEIGALQELRDSDFVEMWDMWPNGDRRWIATPAGRLSVSNGVRQSDG
jgi:hypothetical protein